jgi:hypothetical protein
MIHEDDGNKREFINYDAAEKMTTANFQADERQTA